MNRLMAGLALLVGIAMVSPESGTAQMTTSGIGLTSRTSVQQTLDRSGSSLNNSGTGVFISTTGTMSDTMSSLSIERFETRNRRLYAVVSLGELLDVSGMTPDMVVTSGTTQFSTPGTVVYMDGRYSAIYNDTVTFLTRSRDGFVNLDEGGIADNDGNMIDFGSPGVGDEGENLIDIDEGGIADNDGNIIDFGSPGAGDDGEPLIDIDEGGIADNDGNLVDLGRSGITTTSYGTWSSALGRPVFELNGKTLPMYDRNMLVAVPVSVAGASCDAIQLNLDVSGLTGQQVRRDGTHGAMTDRTLDLKSDLVPVTISSSRLSSTSMTVSDESSSSMCMVSNLVNGQASRHAIVDHLNMLIGTSTTSELQAMR
jgi:hypothetical protein